jgi:hypothetical protein
LRGSLAPKHRSGHSKALSATGRPEPHFEFWSLLIEAIGSWLKGAGFCLFGAGCQSESRILNVDTAIRSDALLLYLQNQGIITFRNLDIRDTDLSAGLRRNLKMAFYYGECSLASLKIYDVSPQREGSCQLCARALKQEGVKSVSADICCSEGRMMEGRMAGNPYLPYEVDSVHWCKTGDFA